MHEGISPNLNQIEEIQQLSRPCEVPDEGLLCDILWSDPATGVAENIYGVKTKGWCKNARGTSYVFSDKIVDTFCNKHDLDLIVRGHQVMEDGYEFFAG